MRRRRTKLRRALPLAVRFRVLARYRFTCVYCGRFPPEVILHVDHVVARANGGGDEESNLVSACTECNLGKKTQVVAHLGPTKEEVIERSHFLQERLARYVQEMQRGKAAAELIAKLAREKTVR